MATKKEINHTAELWLKYYPTFIQWKNFLLTRYDCLIIGICLDRTRDKSEYCPTFFIHNLFTNTHVLTFAYCTYSINRFVPNRYKYNADITIANQYLVENTPILGHIKQGFTFDDYMEHIIHTFNNAQPHNKNAISSTYFDILTVSAYLGCSEYYHSYIEKMKENMILDKFPVDIEAWEKQVLDIINDNIEEIIQSRIREIGLPELENHKLIYRNDKIEFFDKIKSLTAL